MYLINILITYPVIFSPYITYQTQIPSIIPLSYLFYPQRKKLYNEIMELSKNVIDTLVLSDLNSTNGIQTCIEKPYKGIANFNVVRRSVLRQHFGVNLKDNSTSNKFNSQESCVSERFSYGFGKGTSINSVGTDIYNCVTREFSKELQVIAEKLNYLVWNEKSSIELLQKGRVDDYPTIKSDFNHCVILLYYSIEGVKQRSVIGIHNDNIYDRSGNYSKKDNSQMESTPTVTLTLGQNRELNYYLRYSPLLDNSSKRSFWQEDNIKVQTKILSHGSIHVLHPQDEKPFLTNAPGKLSWCQLQHGNTKVKKGQFSIGMVFRTVSNVQKYNFQSRMVPNEDSIKIDNISQAERTHLENVVDFEAIGEKIRDAYKMMSKECYN